MKPKRNTTEKKLSVYENMFLSSFLSFVWICSGSASTRPHQIECMVVNLEYMICTWDKDDKDGTLAENYTFKSSYKNPGDPAECSSYQYVRAVRVGCVVPYSEEELQRFENFYAWLYRDNITIAKQEYKPLLTRVKLNAPTNVSLLLSETELWIYWNVTSNAKPQCQEHEVRYRINGNNWNIYSRIMMNMFIVPFPNTQSLHEFQVRVRVSLTCGESDLWSEWSKPVFWGSMKKINDTEIECMVVNLEYMICTWDKDDKDGTLAENYTFKSSYKNPGDPAECSSYQYVRAVRVGCVVPYSEEELQRFENFYAWLYRDNITIAKQEYKPLLTRVKLNAPTNVSLLLSETELWIYWNVTSNAKPQCQEREVRYRINGNNWIIYSRIMMNMFIVPFPNTQSLHEFQVRVRVSLTCGESDLWSEWSKPVFWGSMKKINDTETRPKTSVGLMILCTIGAAVVLIMLTCLLIHSERLRVILVPVVPSPKNLRDLIDSYDGNVEKWLHISKELQDGFKPNFSERPCIVREFRTETHSESESDDCLSVNTAVSSDYQSMQSYSSTSTLPSPTETPSTETTPLNGL